METFVLHTQQEYIIQRCVLFPFHPMVFSSNPKNCCAFKSPLFSPSFAPFLQTDTRRPKYPALRFTTIHFAGNFVRQKRLENVHEGWYLPNSWIRLVWRSLSASHQKAASRCVAAESQRREKFPSRQTEETLIPCDNKTTGELSVASGLWDPHTVKLSLWLYTVVIEVKTCVLWVKMIMD